MRAGSLDTDEHLARARHRAVDLGQAKDVDVAVSILDDGPHRSAPSSGYWKTSSRGTSKVRAILKAISSVGE